MAHLFFQMRQDRRARTRSACCSRSAAAGSTRPSTVSLPLVLIIVTSRKIAYVGWMLIYLILLPIWNGLLPAYAFWHFDDFSWGQTRKVAGDKDAHGRQGGEFDSTHTLTDSNRYSLTSNSDMLHPPSNTFDNGFGHLRAGAVAKARQQRAADAPHATRRLPEHDCQRGEQQPHVLNRRPSAWRARARRAGGTSLIPLDPEARMCGVIPMIRRRATTAEAIQLPVARATREPLLRQHVRLTTASAGGASAGSGNPFRGSGSPVRVYDEPEEEGCVAVAAAGGWRGGVRLTDCGPCARAEAECGTWRGRIRDGRRRRCPSALGGRGPLQSQPTQNRYLRNSIGFSLPPGAAPRQPRERHQPLARDTKRVFGMVGMMGGSDAIGVCPHQSAPLLSPGLPPLAPLPASSSTASQLQLPVFQYAAHTQGAEWGSRCRVEHGLKSRPVL
ncbi:chitin synthase-domain-containing protein [Mycena rebaudengoi]|nr:chitin synthase-domain-containing protein [Mycena rebaudengoi]